MTWTGELKATYRNEGYLQVLLVFTNGTDTVQRECRLSQVPDKDWLVRTVQNECALLEGLDTFTSTLKPGRVEPPLDPVIDDVPQ